MKLDLDRLRTLGAKLKGQAEARFGADIFVSERFKLLLASLAAIVFLSVVLALNLWTGTLERQYKTARNDLARLDAQIKSGAWSSRRDESKLLKHLLEDRFWNAETPGLAEAGYERWMRDRLAIYRVEPQQVQIRRVPVADGGGKGALADVQRMTAKVFMPFDQSALLSFLADIAESERTMVVERMIVRTGRNARVEMDISTFFRVHERGR